MTYRIPVLERHVAEAIRLLDDEGHDNICAVCPVALAVSEVFGVEVNVNHWQVHYSPEPCTEYCWDLPEGVDAKITVFDTTRQMEPFGFELADFPDVLYTSDPESLHDEEWSSGW